MLLTLCGTALLSRTALAANMLRPDSILSDDPSGNVDMYSNSSEKYPSTNPALLGQRVVGPVPAEADAQQRDHAIKNHTTSDVHVQQQDHYGDGDKPHTVLDSGYARIGPSLLQAAFELSAKSSSSNLVANLSDPFVACDSVTL